MQRNTVKGPEFLKMYVQKSDIIKVLDDVRVDGDVLRNIERMLLDSLIRSYVNYKVRPYHSPTAQGLSSTTKRGIKMGRLSNSTESFFKSAEQAREVKRRGSIEDRLDMLKDEITRNGNADLINDIHKYLVEIKLASRVTGNYSPRSP